MTTCYTVIDLGSNSFHMLTVTKDNDGFSILSKNKQKVRLASGLNNHQCLTPTAIERGLSCLQSFKKDLDTLQPIKVIITATAALRIAKNNELFLAQAENILGYPIKLISGIEEARTIYRGVQFTKQYQQTIFVIDIGGASSELIIGQGKDILFAQSLNMGCVTWSAKYFSDHQLTDQNFDLAIAAAKKIIIPYLYPHKQFDWSICVGSSGTIQAINEVNHAQQLHEGLTLSLLNQLKLQCINAGNIESINIEGLRQSRRVVFPSGLCILIALFECFDITEIELSKGALREGLVSILFE